MNKKQKALFNRAVELGFDKPEARFHVVFHETALRNILDMKEKKKEKKGHWEPSAEELKDAEEDLAFAKTSFVEL